MLYYLLIFLAGVGIDFLDARKYRRLRLLYIFCLYIFLCFGYMTGSDWRSYEPLYESNDYYQYTTEPAFGYLMTGLHFIIKDFWLALGLLKCFYLWTVIRLLKELTPKWMTALAVMIPITLMFMLINNPLRFMLAAAFINLAIIAVYHRKFLPAIVFSVISVLFHNITIVCALYLLLLKKDLFSKFKSWTLVIIYLVLIFGSTLLNAFITSRLGSLSLLALLGVKDYFDYDMSLANSSFSIGTILNLILFLIIIYGRDSFIKKIPQGNFFFSLTVLYCYLFCILHFVPTGFRMVIPLSVYYCVCLAFFIHDKKVWRWFLTLYFLVTMSKNIYEMYVYIPYSNSIPHIIMQDHKSYNERFGYNIKEYKKRTGKDVDYY